MKKYLFTIILLLGATVCIHAQDEPLTVNFKGSKPGISDFVTTILSQEELGEALGVMAANWENYMKGKPLSEGTTITVDSPNGYVRYDVKHLEGEHLYIEFCYWNCADGKHKLIAENITLLVNGEPVDTELTGISFYWYDNDSHKLNYKYAFELGDEVDAAYSATGCMRNLPRQGKTIEFVYFTSNGKITKKLTWNGSKFVNN